MASNSTIGEYTYDFGKDTVYEWCEEVAAKIKEGCETESINGLFILHVKLSEHKRKVHISKSFVKNHANFHGYLVNKAMLTKDQILDDIKKIEA